MSKKIVNAPEPDTTASEWAASLLEADRAEIEASTTLTDAEKRLLLEMDQLSEDEWEIVTVSGTPISETVIADRGER
jgi:hypothetical protein